MTSRNKAAKIRNPSLTLYAFHLRQSISQSPDEVEADAAHLWEKFEQLASPLQIPELNQLRSQLICYQNGEYNPQSEEALLPDDLSLLCSETDGYFPPVIQSDGLELKAMIDPYRIHDTYAADLTLFSHNLLEIAQLSRLNPKGCLLPETIQASLGQTLILFGEPLGQIEDYRPLADDCVAQLLQGVKPPQFMAQGCLCSGPVFEYDTEEEDPSLRCHIWVWFGEEKSLNSIQQISGTLLNLFGCRHKIIYSYYQARYCNDQAKSLYRQLEKSLDSLQECRPAQLLAQWQEIQPQLHNIQPQYAGYLRDLKDYETAISINMENYRELLESLPDAEIENHKFLENFLTKKASKSHRQTQAYLSFLEPGSEFFYQQIAPIEKRVEHARQTLQETQATNQLVLLVLGEGTLEKGFPVVTALLWTAGHSLPTTFTGKLPPNPELYQLYCKWEALYPARARTWQNERIKVIGVRQYSRLEHRNVGKELGDRLNHWLHSRDFRIIADKLREKFQPEDEVRLIIQTSNPSLRHLPWPLWDFFENYPKAEVALSLPEGDRPTKSVPKRTEIRILSLLGNSDNIDIQVDRNILENLPDAKTEFLVQPTRRQVDEQLWHEDGWDILCFSGHSYSKADGETGVLYINQTEKLTLEELKNALKKAIACGLKLAIFNSCDGLGLAYQLASLHLPQIIVMRKPVPDRVAQEFLQNFLRIFSQGKSLYVSVREAREKLQKLEDDYPCATWLPIVCQNPAEVPVTWEELTSHL